jgi:hypothetical protein
MHLESLTEHNLTGIATVVIALCIYNLAITHPIIILFLMIALIIIGAYIIPTSPVLFLMYCFLILVCISRVVK